MKLRKFSIPFSQSINAYDYLKLIKSYSPYIENIFVGIPELENHLSLQVGMRNKHASYEVLKLTKGLYKRIIPYNSIFINEDINDVFAYFDKVIYPFIEEYSVDGFILTNLDLAIKLHRDFPHLEIHTSCNCFQYTLRQMEMWKEMAGVSVFNPPREAGRMPSLLKKMHEYGYVLKVLVNEACVFGCPYQYNHACGISSNKSQMFYHYCCGVNNFDNAMKSNIILPKWLDYLDEFVDIYKIAGRTSPYRLLKNTFDAYILQKKFEYINSYTCCGDGSVIKILRSHGIKIREDDIPDKVRYCESKDCEKTCFECHNAMKKYRILMKESGINEPEFNK